jgi:exosortase A-associated hydrolase 1
MKPSVYSGEPQGSIAALPLVFECEGDKLVGVVHRPATATDLGVIVLVGGPQYRVGGSRLFLMLARVLADGGIAVFRFDPRGIGDSQGQARNYYDRTNDIRSAIASFVRECPTVKRLVVWGICDGASAAILYATHDPRICGAALLNPWIESSQSHARSRLSHYYGRRLFRFDTWVDLVRGRIDGTQATKDVLRSIGASLWRGARERTDAPSSEALAAAYRRYRGRKLLILSGRDQTAAAFMDAIRSSATWASNMRDPSTTQVILEDADHTFSRGSWADAAIETTLSWLGSMSANHSGNEGSTASGSTRQPAAHR